MNMLHKECETLIEVPRDRKLKIVRLEGGTDMRKYLGRMGLGIGSEIRLIHGAPFAGPVMVEHNGGKTAIGRGMAGKIKVEAVE